MRKKKMGDDRVKTITLRKHPKRTTFLVHYSDGRKVETTFVEVMGPSTLYIDPHTKEPAFRTEANINLSHFGSCAICGGDTDDQHAHA